MSTATANDAASRTTPPGDAGCSHTIVIPFYNEQGNVLNLLQDLEAVEKAQGYRWEYVLVDDCGTDGTPALLQQWAASRDRCAVIRMPGNQGQAAALYAGLQKASTPWIITLDGDGQNIPFDIPKLLALADTTDMVVGIRAERQDTWLRRIMSRWANGIRGKCLGDYMLDSGCALKVLDRRIVPALIPIRTLYSFMPAMAVAAGFRVAQTPVTHRPRTAGKSNYGFRVFCWYPLVDMIGMLWYRKRCIHHPHSRPASEVPARAPSGDR